MLADDLLESQIVTSWAGQWALGSYNAKAYCERSEDGGATKATLLDGSLRYQLTTEPVTQEVPGLARSGDGSLYGALVCSDKVQVYRSRLAGTQWLHLQTVE